MKDHQQNILLVEDEPAIREMLRLPIEREGFRFREAADTSEAFKQIQEEKPTLILLDWMLPGQSGVEFIGVLRKNRDMKKIPIIMLTARTEESDKLQGFDAGVDDYLSKPFSIKELLARIHAVLRRYQSTDAEENNKLDVDGLKLEPEMHRVMANDNEVKLGPTEFRLLQHFMTYPERVHSRGQLLNQVWGETVYVEERTVDVHIRRLRKALSATGHDRFIQTVRSAGYRFSNKV